MAKEPKQSFEDEVLAGMADLEKNRATKSAGGMLAVHISDDSMIAYVNVPAPDEAVMPADKPALMAALAQAGVKFGIHENEIDDIYSFGSYNIEVPVAYGQAPVEGTPGAIDLKFCVEDECEAPAEDEHGNIDLRNVSKVTSVEEGDLLAVLTPPAPGTSGSDVLGRELPPKESKAFKLPLGLNTKAGDDGLSVYSTLSGQPTFKENKVNVNPVYEVNGDVNYGTGNIKFNGSVIIKGNVLNDFTVEATEDVDITGNIEKAFIVSGGNVRVRGGIYAAGAGSVKAAGSINIRTVESATLEAGENITITQSCRHSELSAGLDIILETSKGSIVGGKTTAGRHIIVSNIGAPSFTETIVEIGINPKIKKMSDDIAHKLADETAQLEKAIAAIKTIRDAEAHGQPVSPDKHALLQKLVPAAHQLRASIDTDKEKLEFLAEKLKSVKAGRARINYKTYPGVKFFSQNTKIPFTVQKEINHSSFYEMNNQIIIGPY